MLNLDTHIVIHLLAGSLTENEEKLLRSDKWSISAISLWELSKLVQLGRLEIDLESQEVVRALSKIHVWPIDLKIAYQSTQLDINSDPADELIAATSIVHNIPLVTRDKQLKKSKLIPLS